MTDESEGTAPRAAEPSDDESRAVEPSGGVASHHAADSAEPDDDRAPSLGGILGAKTEADAAGRRPITPGDPSLENVVFVLLGVVLTAFVLYRTATVFAA